MSDRDREKSDRDREKKSLEKEVRALSARVEELQNAHAVGLQIEENLRLIEEEERKFSEQLRSIVEITNQLSMTDSVDELCEAAVDFARTRLGFDRMGIWFRSEEEPGTIVGTFGVDANGEVCDERHKKSKIDPASPEGRVLLSKEPLVLEGEATVPAPGGRLLGPAPQVFAAIWDGTKVIGHISMDNQLRRGEVTSRQCELLRLVGSAIGYLCTRKRIEADREKVIADLEDALGKIETLHGMLPICASCKKIRDDGGYWSQIEEYIQAHSKAVFSHGLCPDCMRKLYPELYEEKAQLTRETRGGKQKTRNK